MKDNDGKPSNVHKLLKAVSSRQEPEPSESDDAYDKSHAISRETLMLDVRLANGDAVSWPYLSLRKVKYSRQGVMELWFDGDVVMVEGRNLDPIKSAINQHQQRFIQEAPDIEPGPKSRDVPYIERISITEAGQEE